MRILASVWPLFFLAAERLWSQRWLMLCLLLGLAVAVGLLSSIPLYADAAQNRLLQGELQSVNAVLEPGSNAASETEAATVREPFSFLWRYIGAWHGNVSWDKYMPVQQYLTEQAPAAIGLPLKSQVRHVATDNCAYSPAKGQLLSQMSRSCGRVLALSPGSKTTFRLWRGASLLQAWPENLSRSWSARK